MNRNTSSVRIDEIQRSKWSQQRRLMTVGLAVVSIGFQLMPPIILTGGIGKFAAPTAITALGISVVFLTMSAVSHLTKARASSTAQFFLGAFLSLFLCGAIGCIMHTFRSSFDTPEAPAMIPRTTLSFAAMSLCVGTIALGKWALVVMMPSKWEESRVRSLELANLKLETDELRLRSELSLLRARIEPHFLLNTLNLISGLVGLHPSKARRILECLGHLLRDAVMVQADSHSLDEEIAWSRRYVEILEMRHGNALRVTWQIDDAVLREMVPRMLLQPVLENAIHHGALRRRNGEVHVTIGAEKGERIHCRVQDNGPGVVVAPREGALGVEYVRRRLALSFEDSSFNLVSSEEGTIVTLDWRRAA
jgi:Histidine kinase